MRLTIQIDREVDGCWIAEAIELAGVLAFRVLADRLEHGEASSDVVPVEFIAA